MTLDHRTFIGQYGAPVADPDAPAQAIRFCRRGEGAARRLAGRMARRGRRRLAYVDTHFPWKRSGFRYDEAMALHELRPDTLFFSWWKTTDDFPVRVHPLADFPRLATTAGITDVYAVFLDCAAGLLGEPLAGEDGWSPVVPPSIASVLKSAGMRLHVGMYPGGGLTINPGRLDQARRVAARAATVFTWAPEARDLDHVRWVAPAVLNARFYAPAQRDWSGGPLRLVCAADASPRKGIDTALATFDALPDGYELDVVGPHAHRAAGLARPERVTFHGWLDPPQLRAVFGRSHVMLSPVRSEPDGRGGEMIDGFPTTAAMCAMSTGCALVTANPRSDHAVLTPGRTHVELATATPEELAGVLERLRADRAGTSAIAAEGQRVVRARLDVFGAMRARLESLGLL